MSTLDKIEHRPVSGLKAHPLRARMPKRQKESLAFAALTEDIHANGVNEPLAITPDGHVIDGIERLQSAKDWQIETVPCLIHADEDAPRLIVASLVARRQMQRGAAVYCVIPLMSEFFANCERQRLVNLAFGKNKGPAIPKNLQKANVPRNPTEWGSEDVATACQRLGVGEETLRQARKLHRLLNEPGADFLRTEMGKQGLNLAGVAAVEHQTHQRNALEPRLLAGELGVGAALAGMAGKASTQGTTRVDSVAREAQALDRLFRTPIDSLPRVMDRVIADADPEKLEEIHAIAAEIERLTLAALETSFRAHAAEQSDKVGMAYGN